jgi:hypothetical protein
MTTQDIQSRLSQITSATEPRLTENGTRVHVHYTAFREPTKGARVESSRARELGLPTDRYTGRVSSVWKSRAGDQMLTMLVELERDHKFRTFNLDKGDVHNIVILGQ